MASIALAKAFFAAGFYVQTFPVFGSERRGAPVEAYLRLDDRKILVRSNVYEPDHLMVQDMQLFGVVKLTQGLKKGGWILVNSPGLPRDLGPFEGYRLAHVDAGRIALERGLGSRTQPIINTAMMGAFARMMGAPSLEAVVEAIKAEMPQKREENAAAAREAYEAVVLAGLVEGGRASGSPGAAGSAGAAIAAQAPGAAAPRKEAAK